MDRYEDPKYKIDILPKVLVVITTFVPNHPVVRDTKRSKITGVASVHDENKIDSVKFNIACHNHYDPGVEYDLLIVDNSSENESFVEWLKDSGVSYITRENVGLSFGGWKCAWENNRDKYDYYLFTEQDIVPSKDGWIEEILLRFNKDRDTGAVGNVLEWRSLKDIFPSIYDMTGRDEAPNFDGAFTFTSNSILKRIDKIGGINIIDAEDRSSGVVNEILFQQQILELGYKLSSFNDGKHITTHGKCWIDTMPGEEVLPIAPMVHGHARHFFLDNHFNWYHGA